MKDVKHLTISRRRVYYLLSLMLLLLLIIKEPQATNEEIPMLDIVHLVHNSSNTLIDNLEPNSRSFSAHQAHETPRKSLLTTASEVAITSPIIYRIVGIGHGSRKRTSRS